MSAINTVFTRYFAFLVLAGALAAGCSGNPKNETTSGAGPLADSLFNADFDLRHFNYGMAREEFIPANDSTVLENERDLVVETIALKTGDSIFAECSYHFENDLLQSGEINIFSPNDSINKMVSDTLTRRLNKRYGQGIQSRGFYSWKAKSKKGYALEIFIGDVSYELGSAVTQIQMHADLVEKPMLAVASGRP